MKETEFQEQMNNREKILKAREKKLEETEDRVAKATKKHLDQKVMELKKKSAAMEKLENKLHRKEVCQKLLVRDSYFLFFFRPLGEFEKARGDSAATPSEYQRNC